MYNPSYAPDNSAVKPVEAKNLQEMNLGLFHYSAVRIPHF